VDSNSLTFFFHQDKDPFYDDPKADYHIGSVKMWLQSVSYMVCTHCNYLSLKLICLPTNRVLGDCKAIMLDLLYFGSFC